MDIFMRTNICTVWWDPTHDLLHNKTSILFFLETHTEHQKIHNPGYKREMKTGIIVASIKEFNFYSEELIRVWSAQVFNL
jgi:hypothetical protein